MKAVAKDRGPTTGHYRTVIVGVDEHQGGRDATALAMELLAGGGSLTRARVYIRDSLVGRNLSPDIRAVSSSPKHPGRRGGDDDATSDEVQKVEASSVGRGLHELALAKGADLLVIGSCRRGLIGRVMIEDDTWDALNGAPCAVAIAPFGFAERPPVLDEIGVAYNGSLESQDALAVARALAVEHDSRLSAFHAVSVPSYMSAPGAGTGLESPPELVDQARSGIAALGEVEPHAAYGVPAEELAVYSASLDLLVVGSRGYGPVGRLVHGSTSRRLARTARCPLLVLTRDARARLPADLNHPGRVPAEVTAS